MAQVIIQATDTVSASRAVLNQMFTELYAAIGVGVSGSAALTFPSMADGETQELTIAVVGAVANHPVAPSWPSTFPAKWQGMMLVTGSNVVTVRVTNQTGATATLPAAADYGATVF